MRILAALLALLLLTSVARAQSTPGFVNGQVVTAPQLNSAFATKQDFSSVFSQLKTIAQSASACNLLGFTGPNAFSLYTIGTGLTCVGNVLSATSAAVFYPSVTKTVNYVIQPNDTGTTFNNVGATGTVTLTLPSVSGNNGRAYCFVASVAQPLVVQAAVSDQISVGLVVGNIGGFAESSVTGSTLCLTANNNGQWAATSSPTGYWSQDGLLFSSAYISPSNVGQTEKIAGTGTQSILANTTVWAPSSCADATLNLPTTPVNNEVHRVINGGLCPANSMTVSGNGNTIGPTATGVVSVTPGAVDVRYMTVLGYWQPE